MRLFNTLTQRIEPLFAAAAAAAAPPAAAAAPPALSWYQCGPTVYDDTHLGHARTYVTFDLLRRVLTTWLRRPVHLAQGVTDIDDKILARAAASGVPPAALAARYEARFFDDMHALGVLPPTTVCRVTDHIAHIELFVQRLLDRGHAYRGRSSRSVYFDVEAWGPRYGRLHTPAAAADAAPLEQDGDKRSPRDFALWKAAPAGADPAGGEWCASALGLGRPGWHIECSAMASSLFGASLDLHTGGVDLKFPHHENEIAQCEAHHGTDSWVRHFAHAGHLDIEGRKMSKSLKNFVSVREYLAGGGTADQWRMLCLLHGYRSTVHYNSATLCSAADVLDVFASARRRIPGVVRAALRRPAPATPADHARFAQFAHEQTRVSDALVDDFDTPSAVQALVRIVRLINASSDPHLIMDMMRFVDDTLAMFGLFQHDPASGDPADAGSSTATMDVAMLLGDLRSTARAAVLDKASSSADIRKTVLGACDRARDGLAAATGLEIQDKSKEAGAFVVVRKASGRD